MLHREAFIFLSSPGSVTPFHMDPEHNIMLQIRGEKTMTVFPAGDEELVPAVQSEAFHAGGHRNLDRREGVRERGMAGTLLQGYESQVTGKDTHFGEKGHVGSAIRSETNRTRVP